MACRKHSPGDPCCPAGCTFNSADLPTSFEFRGTTILRADWGSFEATNGCCWGYSILFPQAYNNRLFACSAEVALSSSEAMKIATYRYLYGTSFSISKQVSTCDGLPSVDQFIVSIIDFYVGKYNSFVYNPPSPSCETLSSRLDSLFPGGYAFSYYVARVKYYAALPTGAYNLTTTNVSDCSPECKGALDFTNSITFLDVSTGATLTINDTSTWTYNIVA